MSKVYSDYFKEVTIQLPEQYINVRTGETHLVSKQIEEQVAYHGKNNTLLHLVLSALDHFFNSVEATHDSYDIMEELLEIKQILQRGNVQPTEVNLLTNSVHKKIKSNELIRLEDAEEIVEAYGG